MFHPMAYYLDFPIGLKFDLGKHLVSLILKHFSVLKHCWGSSSPRDIFFSSKFLHIWGLLIFGEIEWQKNICWTLYYPMCKDLWMFRYDKPIEHTLWKQQCALRSPVWPHLTLPALWVAVLLLWEQLETPGIDVLCLIALARLRILLGVGLM